MDLVLLAYSLNFSLENSPRAVMAASLRICDFDLKGLTTRLPGQE